MNHFTEYAQKINSLIYEHKKIITEEWKSNLLSECVPKLGLPTSEIGHKGPAGTLFYLAAESFIQDPNQEPDPKQYLGLIELLYSSLNSEDFSYSSTGALINQHIIGWVQQKIISLDKVRSKNSLSLLNKYHNLIISSRIENLNKPNFNTDVETVTTLYANQIGISNFTLPLILGYVTTAPTIDYSTILLLECIGQSLGIIKQGLADEAGFTKPESYHFLVSKLKNHAPSLWLSTLLPLLDQSEQSVVRRLSFGSTISRFEVECLYTLYEKYHVREKLQTLYRTEARLVHELIGELGVTRKLTKVWHGLVQAVLEP